MSITHTTVVGSAFVSAYISPEDQNQTPMNQPHNSNQRHTRWRVALPFLLSAFTCLAAERIAAADELPLYKDTKASLEQRVDDLFGRLTPDEKLQLLTGTGFGTPALPRLGVPAMEMADAGQGVRGGASGTLGPATAFPSGVAMASTWDVDLLNRIGAAIGQEARNKGTGAWVLLGPAVNIQRSPFGGRNGEYFSEDPFLSSRLAVAYIQGMQRTGVAACIKHYACNNEEDDRDYVDVKVGERALREIYLRTFEAGVKEGKVWTLMSSYNKVNGPHASANPYLLLDVLKKGWGFDGLVMSDWGGVHDTAVAQVGNDLEMPGGKLATIPKLRAALRDGSLTQAAVDDSARRVLRTILRVGLLDDPAKPDHSVVNSPEHQKLALEAANKSIVLLKNQGGLLPLDRTKIHSIAVIGEAGKNLIVGALGSPEVKPFYRVQILDGIRKQAGANISVSHVPGHFLDVITAENVTVPGSSEHGFKAEYFKGTKLEGPPVLERIEGQIQMDTADSPGPGVPAENFSTRWTADLKVPSSGRYNLAFTGDDGFRVKLDGRTIIERWENGGALLKETPVEFETGKSYRIEVEFYQAGGAAVAKLEWLPPTANAWGEAVAAAKQADVAVVCVSTHRTEGEGRDRVTMDLPGNQDELIQAVAAANKNTVVVLNNGTPVTMTKWIKEVPALLETWFPGQEGGAAVAAILFGDVNPSGRLPTTFGSARSDYPDYGNFPGAKGVVKYEEGIYVGYRHFDKKSIEPLFPFGHGLSYTTFRYKKAKLSASSLKADGTVQVQMDVTNTGKRAGAEVVQLYVHDLKSQIDKPVRELKGFKKVALNPGETKTVTLTLTARDLAYFDVPGKQWKADAGKYEIEIGSSSRDIRQKVVLNFKETFTEAVPLSKEFAF